MHPLYQEALNGTLRSDPKSNKPLSPLVVQNDLHFAVNVYALTTTGKRTGWILSENNGYQKGGNNPVPLRRSGEGFRTTGLCEGDILFFTAVHSGGFLGVIALTNQKNVVLITHDHISDPNDIGSVPKPTKQVIIPHDSPRVVVGAGTIAVNVSEKHTVVREQYWRRLPDSYSLAPGAKKQISYTLTMGMQSTTSQQDTISKSLGLSVSGGWGPVSASISASLSSTSTTFQQQTYTTQSTTYTSLELHNTTQNPQTLLVWQLTDVVTIFDTRNLPLGSVVTGGEPAVIYGPYNPLGLVDKLPLVTAQDVLESHGEYPPDADLNTEPEAVVRENVSIGKKLG